MTSTNPHKEKVIALSSTSLSKFIAHYGRVERHKSSGNKVIGIRAAILLWSILHLRRQSACALLKNVN